MSDSPDCVSSHNTELVDVPILEVRLVHDGDLDVSVVDGLRIVRPILITFLSALLHTPSQHDDGSGVRLPAHPPEVITSRVKGTLSHYELPLGVKTGNKVCIYVVRTIFVISRLELDSAVVLRKNVCESVLRPVDRKVCSSTRLVSANMLQLLKLLAEPEVAVCRHDAVVLGKVLQLDWS